MSDLRNLVTDREWSDFGVWKKSLPSDRYAVSLFLETAADTVARFGYRCVETILSADNVSIEVYDGDRCVLIYLPFQRVIVTKPKGLIARNATVSRVSARWWEIIRKIKLTGGGRWNKQQNGKGNLS